MMSASDVPPSTADVNATSSPAKFKWIQVVELGYIEDNAGGSSDNADGSETRPLCFHCGAAAIGDSKLSKCSKCQVASYCSRDCQVCRNASWRLYIYIDRLLSISCLISSFRSRTGKAVMGRLGINSLVQVSLQLISHSIH